MYADRYARKTKLNPGSLALALAINGAIMAGLIYSVPTIIKQKPKPFVWVNIKEPTPPPPEQQKPIPQDIKLKTLPAPAPHIPQPIVETYLPSEVHLTSTPDITPLLPEGTGGTGVVVPPAKPPVTIGPELDSRYAGSFQPNYPATERRAEHEGRVVVRVLVGIDGRVKQVERVSAASDAFFDATRERAMDKWRFKPATRDGIPVEAWRSVGVSFVLNDSN
jgi:protein TonB